MALSNTFHPVHDFWFLARSQKGYYGGYPEGFLRRAKIVMGHGKMLHLCSGTVQEDRAYGNRDKTLDIRKDVGADYVRDATNTKFDAESFRLILLDPPYTEGDAEHYGTGCPEVKDLMTEAFRICKRNGRIGLLHYIVPRVPRGYDAELLGLFGVMVGFGNRVRVLTVFRKL